MALQRGLTMRKGHFGPKQCTLATRCGGMKVKHCDDISAGGSPTVSVRRRAIALWRKYTFIVSIGGLLTVT